MRWEKWVFLGSSRFSSQYDFNDHEHHNIIDRLAYQEKLNRNPNAINFWSEEDPMAEPE